MVSPYELSYSHMFCFSSDYSASSISYLHLSFLEHTALESRPLCPAFSLSHRFRLSLVGCFHPNTSASQHYQEFLPLDRICLLNTSDSETT